MKQMLRGNCLMQRMTVDAVIKMPRNKNKCDASGCKNDCDIVLANVGKKFCWKHHELFNKLVDESRDNLRRID